MNPIKQLCIVLDINNNNFLYKTFYLFINKVLSADFSYLLKKVIKYRSVLNKFSAIHFFISHFLNDTEL